MKQCPDNNDCGHDEAPTFGDVEFRRIRNVVSGRDDLIIERADPHILIAEDIVEDAFNNPQDTVFGRIDFGDAIGLSIILHGRNKTLRYTLGRHREQAHAWEATLVAATVADAFIQTEQ